MKKVLVLIARGREILDALEERRDNIKKMNISYSLCRDVASGLKGAFVWQLKNEEES